MNSQQIQYFLSAAKNLNFTKVAEEHYSSQPTVSRQIALLEQELGVSLFARNKGALRLTAEGVILAREFDDAQKRLNYTLAKVKGLSSGIIGQLSIGYLSFLDAEKFLYPKISEFSGKYPDVDVKIEGAKFSTMRENLANGIFDVIYTYNFELPSLENVSSMAICPVKSMFVMSHEHPFSEKKGLNFSDFSGQRFLSIHEDEILGRKQVLSTICDILEITDIKIETVPNLETLLFAINQRRGIGLLSSAMNIFASGKYFCFPLPARCPKVFVTAIWSNANRNAVLPLFLE